jgi:hypothetical protein
MSIPKAKAQSALAGLDNDSEVVVAAELPDEPPTRPGGVVEEDFAIDD